MVKRSKVSHRHVRKGVSSQQVVSNTTIFILLAIVIVVSVMSLMIYLRAANNAPSDLFMSPGRNSGDKASGSTPQGEETQVRHTAEVTLTILPPEKSSSSSS